LPQASGFSGLSKIDVQGVESLKISHFGCRRLPNPSVEADQLIDPLNLAAEDYKIGWLRGSSKLQFG
jgi:hypothetical protein